MESNSSVTVNDTPEGLVVTINGMISERSEFPVPSAAGKRVILDTAGVHHINSLGVKAWIDFLGRLCSQTQDVVMRRLSPPLVLQASMISSFLGCARVESFMTPWVCDSCDSETQNVQPSGAAVPESHPCAGCGGVMELDSDPAAYLSFWQAE